MTSQVQDKMAQVKWEVGPRVPHHDITMASRLRDITSINPLMLYGQIENEDPHVFLDEVYDILVSMGLATGEKTELAAYQLKDVAQI